MNIDIFKKIPINSLQMINRFGHNSIKHQGISLNMCRGVSSCFIEVIAHVPRKYLSFLRKSVNIGVARAPDNDNKHWYYFLYTGFEDFKPLVEDAHNLLLEKSIEQYKKYQVKQRSNNQKYKEKQKNLVKRFF